MQSIGILDALSMWFDGEKIDGAAIYGFPVVWIGRIGKVLAFVSGLTVVLDVIGPARLIEYGSHFASESIDSKIQVFAAYMIGIPLLPWLVFQILAGITESPWAIVPAVLGFMSIMVGSAIYIFTYFPGLIIAKIGKFFERRENQSSFRVVAIFLFFLGFAVDMATS